MFTPQNISSSQVIHEGIVANYSDTPVDAARLDASASRILELYPDKAALGSPFNTGNETFGLDSQFKRSAAISESGIFIYTRKKELSHDYRAAGDLMFQAPRRLWTQAASRAGLRTFGYLFTGPTLPVVPPSFGGEFIFPYAPDY